MRVLLRETVRLALAAGLLELAVVAVDGSKVSGSAARERSYDEAGLLALLERTETAIAELEAQNHADDDAPPRLPPGLRDPAALRTQVETALGRLRADGRSCITISETGSCIGPRRNTGIPHAPNSSVKGADP